MALSALQFGGKYRLEDELAVGGCGTVFVGVHTIAGKEVAVKIEAASPTSSCSSAKKRSPTTRTPLQQESKIYRSLMGGEGVPWMMWSGRQGDFNVMIIDLLGPSLEDMFKTCNRHFSLKTVLLLADQLLSRIEFIHSNALIHRDIKPANFVMGSPSSSSAHLVNVIDFGLAKRFRDARTREHVKYHQEDGHGVGTALFAALNTHIGIECSRRDDLESLAYMLIYFMRGSLPWRRTKGATVAETWDLIRDRKIAAEATLTAGLPAEFSVLYSYARNLAFDDLPDYEGLRALFRGLAEKRGIKYDGVFDWSSHTARRVRRRGCEACCKRC